MSIFPSKVNYTTGQVLTATEMNEIGQAINLLESAQYAAGKNKIINGDFGVWQRGTSFSNPANEAYLCDRFNIVFDGTGSTRTISRQAQTPGTISGNESPFFFRFNQSVAGSGGTFVGTNQRIEGVENFAGQTVTLSFYAKADAARTVLPNLQQNFGAGGSATVNITSGFSTINLTTSFVRYTATVAVPSISGKTVGTSSFLQLFFGFAANTVQTIDIWGVQLEAAATDSPFQTATGTKQGELAACQRYFYLSASGTNQPIANGNNNSATLMRAIIPFPVTMRTTPTVVASSGTDFYLYQCAAANDTFNSITLGDVSTNAISVFNNTQISGTAGQGGLILTNNASSSVAFSAEI